MQRADGILAVSKALKETLVGYGIPSSKIHVVYNGVDKQKFRPVDRAEARRHVGIDENKTVFLFLGNLKVEKGPVDLLKAFVRLANNEPDKDLELVLIGARGDRGYVDSCIESAKKEHPHLNILAPGPKKHDELNDWLNAADFLCLPSYSEGVPNVILEAMSCGIPTIASTVGGIPEVVDETVGILVPSGDVDALQSAMNTAIETNWDRDAILERSERFDWDRNAAKVARILNGDAALEGGEL